MGGLISHLTINCSHHIPASDETELLKNYKELYLNIT